MIARRLAKQATSLDQRLADEAKRLREQVILLPYGAIRDTVIRKARQTEAAAHMSDWLNSPGLRPPK